MKLIQSKAYATANHADARGKISIQIREFTGSKVNIRLTHRHMEWAERVLARSNRGRSGATLDSDKWWSSGERPAWLGLASHNGCGTPLERGNASLAETARFSSVMEETLQKILQTLGGREIGSDDSEDTWHDNELYGVSIEGRRFVFRDPTAFHRFKEELKI